MTRAYRDVGARLLRLPGRLWCALWHRRLWKVWRRIDNHHGRVWVSYYCRVCGKEFICPRG